MAARLGYVSASRFKAVHQSICLIEKGGGYGMLTRVTCIEVPEILVAWAGGAVIRLCSIPTEDA
jgi:hypothetical protein